MPISADTFPPVIEGTRIFLRVPRQGDGEDVYKAIVESREEFLPWLPFAREEPAVEKSEQWASQQHAKFIRGEAFGMLVFDRFTHELVGSSGFAQANFATGECEIGYWIRTSRSGRGLMSEAVLTLSDFCLYQADMNRVEIRTDPANLKSIAVAERAGFNCESRLTQNALTPDGNPRDTLIYVRTK